MKRISMFRAIIAATIAVAGMHAAAAQADSNVPPAQNCTKLLSADFSRVPEAPTQVLGANLVEAKDNVPGHCSVKGVVTPRVGFELKMPLENWNGKFFQAGCGNWCGVIYPKACDDPLRRGYACIATDSGHKAPTRDPFMTDAKWAYNNLEAELDWGGRATHVTAVAGKAITESFYSSAPTKAYFMGCSYGGHQAMVLAQRFPFDFDGIVGGGAPNNIGELMQQNAWAITHGFDANLKSVFSEDDIKVLHGAALARCDLDDGIKDGLVTNPRACKVDPDALVCKSGQTSNCLSRKSAGAAKKMYSGATNSKGESLSLTPGSWTPGSEIDWRDIYRSDGKGLAALADNYFRYMGRQPDLGPEWQVRDYDFDRDYRRNDVMETLYSAGNPDLRRFKQAGGKFINYVGWNDLGTVPDKRSTITKPRKRPWAVVSRPRISSACS